MAKQKLAADSIDVALAGMELNNPSLSHGQDGTEDPLGTDFLTNQHLIGVWAPEISYIRDGLKRPMNLRYEAWRAGLEAIEIEGYR